jgi:hemoglobin/transferrin/lactoferrin receptor protein
MKANMFRGLMLSACSTALVLGAQGARAQGRDAEDRTGSAADRLVSDSSLIVVTGQRETRDEAGKDGVYDKDVSNVYAGKDEIERYRGSSVGDLFRGLNGVYSGDSRNSGALDPNIRGIQGEGRIPVSVDGTEQSTSVWMGPAGVANRNYVDPNMIGSIMVEKGPSTTRGLRTGIGGAVQVNTLEPADIVQRGRSFGIEMKLETATNAVKPIEKAFAYFGQDYRYIDGAWPSGFGQITFGLDNGYTINPRKGSSGFDFKAQDAAFRIAAAVEKNDFDLLAAYSWRSRGNYYAGKGGAEAYRTDRWREEATQDLNSGQSLGGLGHSYIANFFKPGEEVTNISSDMESILLKGALRLAGDHEFKASFMRTEQTYGESVPWTISWALDAVDGSDTQAQQPYSELQQNTYNLTYAWAPSDMAWIDFRAGVWMTESQSARHQNGDLPYGLGTGMFGAQDRTWNEYVRCHVRTDLYKLGCENVSATPPERLADPEGNYKIAQRAMQLTDHRRWGFNLSNHVELSSALAFTLSGDFSREKLDQWDASFGLPMTEQTWGVNHMGPREGSRQQWNFAIAGSWKPTPWLQVDAGYRYSDYWSFDDQLAERRAAQSPNWRAGAVIEAWQYSYQELMTDAEQLAFENIQREYYVEELAWLTSIADEYPEAYADFIRDFPSADAYAASGRDENGLRYTWFNDPTRKVVVPNTPNFEGFAASNPFANGTIDPNEMVTNPQGVAGSFRRYIGFGSSSPIYGPEPADPWAAPKKNRGHGWVPHVSATLRLADNMRVYGRYSEFLRFPSVFEATQAAYGMYGASLGTAASRPEHAFNWEVGYVVDLKRYVSSLRAFDFRINYFSSTIKNYIDRDSSFNIIQFDKKKTSGIEIQSRVDTGIFFANAGATLRLKQQMCDADYASWLDPVWNRIPDCVKGGFPRTFARTAVQPEYSINVDVGARLLDKRLELGGRMVYHSEAGNDDEALFGEEGWAYNRTYYWNPILVFDAYANWRINPQVSFDLGVNNLTNRYYIDPMARVSLPAPGRTVRVGLTARF